MQKVIFMFSVRFINIASKCFFFSDRKCFSYDHVCTWRQRYPFIAEELINHPCKSSIRYTAKKSRIIRQQFISCQCNMILVFTITSKYIYLFLIVSQVIGQQFFPNLLSPSSWRYLTFRFIAICRHL